MSEESIISFLDIQKQIVFSRFFLNIVLKSSTLNLKEFYKINCVYSRQDSKRLLSKIFYITRYHITITFFYIFVYFLYLWNKTNECYCEHELQQKDYWKNLAWNLK